MFFGVFQVQAQAPAEEQEELLQIQQILSNHRLPLQREERKRKEISKDWRRQKQLLLWPLFIRRIKVIHVGDKRKRNKEGSSKLKDSNTQTPRTNQNLNGSASAKRHTSCRLISLQEDTKKRSPSGRRRAANELTTRRMRARSTDDSTRHA
ncbi:uncharacterized protein LOC117645569 [Thrips palmi]|uniref:Uncharacterized protein LOC117645569 n=1 Tax=Thrips palmi TaxID=161013 RepID=A0A6P8ZN54_THRPL|nr:uncharacterized protein LOC117645569 [Thrips palmi]